MHNYELWAATTILCWAVLSPTWVAPLFVPWVLTHITASWNTSLSWFERFIQKGLGVSTVPPYKQCFFLHYSEPVLIWFCKKATHWFSPQGTEARVNLFGPISTQASFLPGWCLSWFGLSLILALCSTADQCKCKSSLHYCDASSSAWQAVLEFNNGHTLQNIECDPSRVI